MRPITLQHTPQPARRLQTSHPLIHSHLIQRTGIIALSLHKMRPKLFFLPLNQHLGHMRQPKERDMPVPHARLVVLRCDIFAREERLFGQGVGKQHLAEREVGYAFGMQAREAEGICCAAVFAVDGELLESELRHEFGHVFGVGAPIVAFACGGLVGCAETAEVGRDDCELLGQEGGDAVPVVVCFGCAVEEE